MASKLKEAFTKCGFVYLSGHGVQPRQVEAIFDETRSFFEDFSVSAKESSCPRDKVTTQGYVKLGLEKLDVLKLEDSEAV